MTEDDQGRDWAGDQDVQKQIVKAIMSTFCDYDTVDLVGALETCLANIICDASPNRNVALEGLQLCIDDMMKGVINQRFPASSKN